MSEGRYIKAEQAGEEFVLNVTVPLSRYNQMENAVGVIVQCSGFTPP